MTELQAFTSLRLDDETIKTRTKAVRKLLKENNIDGFIVPHNNEFLTEYLRASDERLAWVSGFTGSAGCAIILEDKAAIFTDGRYQLQIAAETNKNIFEIHHSINFPLNQWIEKNLEAGKKIGLDPRLNNINSTQQIEKAICKTDSQIVFMDKNLIDLAWHDRPKPPKNRVIKHDIALAGKPASQKIAEISAKIKAPLILCDPISICWLLNIRGSDVPNTPIVLASAILYKNQKLELFIDEARLDEKTRKHIKMVDIKKPENFNSALEKLKAAQLDKNKTPFWALLQLEQAEIVFADDPCELPKAIKNQTELEGIRNAHIRDGVALTKFLFWLWGQSPPPDEIGAVRKIEQLRAEQNMFFGISFDSIAGSGANGAIIHYRVNEKTNRKLQNGDLFLLDSGGQYLDGTTDVTRTIAIGCVGEEEKENFTRVLQGHIALASVVFPLGTCGMQLDVLARQPLWQAGLDFDHGTGHGVGAFLSVHEGPQGISPRGTNVALREGMVISNEPGFYKQNTYGIRIENLVAVVKKPNSNDREMLGFETLTCAPLDISLIMVDMLSSAEKLWVNQYHQWVFKKLTPLLDKDCLDWLKDTTRAI